MSSEWPSPSDKTITSIQERQSQVLSRAVEDEHDNRQHLAEIFEPLYPTQI